MRKRLLRLTASLAVLGVTLSATATPARADDGAGGPSCYTVCAASAIACALFTMGGTICQAAGDGCMKGCDIAAAI